MSRVIITLLCAVISIVTASPDPAEYAGCRSADPQVRADAFYDIFNADDYDGPTPWAVALEGLSTHEILVLLGAPDRVSTLHYEGVTWRYAHYELPLRPIRASAEAYAQGWRFTPAVLFRNEEAVNFQRMYEELDLKFYSMLPERFRFKPGGTFP